MKSWNELLWLYLSNEITAADYAAFEKLLASNPSYRKELDEWQRIKRVVRVEAQSRMYDLPRLNQDFFQKLETKQGSSRRMLTVLVPLTAAAAMVLVFLFVILVILANKPKEPEVATLMSQTPKMPIITEFPSTETLTAAWLSTPTPLPLSATMTELANEFVTSVETLEGGSPSVTPSLIEPVISAPAQVVSRIILPSSDTTDGINWTSNGMLIVDGYGSIWLYDDLTAPPRSIPTDADGAVDVGVSADGRLLLVLNWDGSLVLWDATTGTQLSRMENGPLWDQLQFNPDKLEVISRLQNGVVTIDADNQLVMGDPLPQVDTEANYYYLNPADSTQLINYTYTGRVIVSTRDGQILRSFGEENPNAFPRSVAFNDNATMIALGQDDGFIRVYELETGKLVTTMSHSGRVYDLAFSPDGRYISAMIETSPVYTLWMWNLENNLQYAAVVHDLPLIGPAFNAAGDQLAISTIDGRVLILDVTAYP